MILIYDDNCPFCSWYSRQFVRFGFLPDSGRKAFSAADPTLLNKIDFEKSRNEIPLIDTKTGKVFYGIDALLEILAQKIPLIKKTGNILPVKWFLKKLYKLISYNRKVIVAKKCGPGSIDCTPDLNIKYRLLFISLFLIVNTFLLFPIQNQLFSRLPFYKLSMFDLGSAYIGLVLLNYLLAFGLQKEKRLEYIGQLTMLAVTSILLLIVLLFLNLFNLPLWFILIYLFLTTVFTFKEYIRRMDFAGILLSNKWLVSLNLVSLFCFIFYLFHLNRQMFFLKLSYIKYY